MKKIVICGVWHVHAEGYTKTAMEHAEVIGVWDADEKRKAAFCEELGLKAFADLGELLASGADGAIVCAATDIHADVIVQLAAAKMDIFTEKVLALSEADCDRIEKAVRENGVKFVISLVQKYTAGPLTVKSVMDSGELGKISYVRFRNCHSGSSRAWLPPHFYSAKECGGGAMIDLGAHGMYLIDWLCGIPVTVKSVFGNASVNEEANRRNPDGVEDNAVTVMGFAGGVIAVNETGFVSGNCPMMLEVDGENGFVRFTAGSGVIKRTASTGGKDEAVTMLDAQPAPLLQFLTDKILPGCGIAEARALTHLMVEAYRG